MTDQELIQLAQSEGFTAALIPTGQIVTDETFRPFCEENLCGNFNANYSCPPDCGTVEQTRQRLMAQDRALVLQRIWPIGSYENKPAILEAKRNHNAAVLRLTRKLREQGLTGFCLGYGGCPLCSPCKRVTGEACPHPESRISCMSAYCIDVAKLAQTCQLPFAWEPEKLYLFGMFAFQEKSALLETPRLSLRNLRPEDVERLYAYRNDPRCSQYQRYDDITREGLEAFVETFAHSRFLSLEEEQHYAIVSGESKEMMGDLTLFYTPSDNCFTLGITIAPDHQHQGYASEILQDLIATLQRHYPAVDIVMLIEKGNAPSVALAKKLNFFQECYAESIGSYVFVINGKGD